MSVLAGIFVVVISVLLFAYWFRYTCFLILSSRSARKYSRLVAEANGLSFLTSRTALQEMDQSRMDSVRQSLDRDFQLVTYLLKHGASFSEAGQPFEQLILRLNYRVLSVWYRIVRNTSSALARQTLLEMTSVIGHLANAMGERTAIASRV